MFPAFAFPATAFPVAAFPRFASPAVARPFIVELIAFLTSTLPGVPVFPGHIPRDFTDYPAVVYNRVFADRWLRLSGPSGLAKLRIQFDCYSTDDFEALTADESLRKALQPFTGMMGTVRVREANLHDQGSGYEEAADESDQGTYRHRSEFTFIYDEA